MSYTIKGSNLAFHRAKPNNNWPMQHYPNRMSLVATVLQVLPHTGEGMRPVVLAERVGVSVQQASATLRWLEGRGVERVHVSLNMGNHRYRDAVGYRCTPLEGQP